METNFVVHEPIVLMEEEKTHRKLAIVDINQVGNNPDLMEDLIDIIIAEARHNEAKFPWSQVKEELKLK
jgi:hypothetical protein